MATAWRAYAFIDGVSDTKNGTDTPNTTHVTGFEVAPTVGLTGGVTGAVADIFNAYYGNQATAYANTTSDPFNVPVTAGFDKTTYKVLVVGPGINNASLISSLTSTQENSIDQDGCKCLCARRRDSLSFQFLFWQRLSLTLRQGAYTPSAAGSKFKADLINNFENDALNFIGSVPAIQDEIMQGDYKGAMRDLFVTGANSGSLRTLFEKAAQEAAVGGILYFGWQPGVLSQAGKKFNIVLNAAGGVLQIFDSSVMKAQLAQADAVDQWTIITTAQKVTLTPATSFIPQVNGSALLTATVPGVTPTGYSYLWTIPGTAGRLAEVGGAHRTSQISYCSSGNQTIYIPNLTPPLTKDTAETVTVQFFSKGNCDSTGAAGTATATVTVQAPNSGLRNGDFSQGLSNWSIFGNVFQLTVGNTVKCNPAQNGNNFAALNSYGVDEGIQQTFQVPAGATTLTMRVWGNLDPVSAQITIVDKNGVKNVLDNFTPPSLEVLSNPRDPYSSVCSGSCARFSQLRMKPVRRPERDAPIGSNLVWRRQRHLREL